MILTQCATAAWLALAATPVEQVDACIADSSDGQRLRDEGHLLAARSALARCAQAQCPDVVQRDCQAWLAGVEASLPRVQVRVRNEAGELVEVTAAWLDGQHVEPGAALSVDPGHHLLEVDAGGQRLVSAVDAVAGGGEVAVTLHVRDHARRPPVGALVVGGLGVVGLGLFSGLGLSGRLSLEALERSACATSRTCPEASVSSVRTRFAAADVALVTGLVALATAALWWWLEPAPPGGAAGVSAAGAPHAFLPAQAR